MSWGGCFSRWVLNKSILEQISFHEFPEASSEVICWSTVLSFFLSKGFQEEILSGLFLVLRIELCRCKWPYLSSLLLERHAANIVTASFACLLSDYSDLPRMLPVWALKISHSGKHLSPGQAIQLISLLALFLLQAFFHM